MEVYVNDILVKSKLSVDHLTDLRETFATLRKYQMKLNPEKCTISVGSGKFLGFMVSQRGIEANPEKIKALCRRARGGGPYATTVRTRDFVVAVLNLEPKSPNLANRFEKQIFEKVVPNMDCFTRYRVAT